MVTVCHNYSDFLEETLPHNMESVDRMVGVTHPDDKKTISLCQKFSVDCVQTVAMHEDGDKFNKGRAINMGLGHMRGVDWILHLDADCLLPHNFKNMLHRAKLNPKNIYGADRVNVMGSEIWDDHKHKLTPHYSSGYFVQPPKEFPIGARIIHHEIGYTPIGYFQLWNKAMGKKYPIHQGNAEHTDVLFAAYWPRENRILLPEVIVCHLESHTDPQPMAANWNGRITPHFRHKKHHHKPHHGHCGCGYHHHHKHCHHHKHSVLENV